MKKIPLTRGKFALVDDEDYDEISKFKWYATKSTVKHSDNWYANRQYRDPSQRDNKGQSKQICIQMHRKILDAPVGVLVDHRDGNGLNNQKYNLRKCSHQQNLWNSKWEARPDKPYKGVQKYKSKSHNGWTLTIGINGRPVRLGWFKSAEVAARAYDALAEQMYGEFARLNFPK